MSDTAGQHFTMLAIDDWVMADDDLPASDITTMARPDARIVMAANPVEQRATPEGSP